MAISMLVVDRYPLFPAFINRRHDELIHMLVRNTIVETSPHHRRWCGDEAGDLRATDAVACTI